MERITSRIAEKVALELELDKDRKEVIAYGTFALIHMLFSIMLVALFGVVFGTAVEALIISFTASILRKYSGGVHAGTPGLCAIIGTVVCVGQGMIISYLLASVINFNWTMLLGAFTFTYSYYLVYKLAPVDSPAKPIKRQEKKERMRKGSIILLTVYLAIVIFGIGLYLYTKDKQFLVFSLCIYGGIAWQSFTLTKVGHKLFSIIDSFYNQILNLIRRRK